MQCGSPPNVLNSSCIGPNNGDCSLRTIGTSLTYTADTGFCFTQSTLSQSMTVDCVQQQDNPCEITWNGVDQPQC